MMKCASAEKSHVLKETDVRVRRRFHEALDHHFFFYQHNHPERRMAICEGIERSIVVE